MNIRHAEQSAVPSGLIAVAKPNPNAEALGYYHSSLRDDEIEILVALDEASALLHELALRQPPGTPDLSGRNVRIRPTITISATDNTSSPSVTQPRNIDCPSRSQRWCCR